MNIIYKLNKTDKYLLISLIILIMALVLPVVLIFLLVALSVDFKFEIPYVFEISFIFAVINYIFIVPILFITKIIIFIIKIFSKNKNIKDWIIILLDFVVTLYMGLICLIAYCGALLL